MKQPQPSLEYFGAFSDKFRRQTHQLVALGYQDAIARIKTPQTNKDLEETSITGFIVSALENRGRAFRPSPRWIKHYDFHDNSPQNEHALKVGKRRPLVDIVIKWVGGSGRPELLIEAKRLQSGISEYVGTDGMGCFIGGEYGSRYDESVMLGYVQSDDVLSWVVKVKQKINKDKNKLHLIGKQQDIKVVSKFPDEWCSTHERNNLGRPIKIYHILLDCIVP